MPTFLLEIFSKLFDEVQTLQRGSQGGVFGLGPALQAVQRLISLVGDQDSFDILEAGIAAIGRKVSRRADISDDFAMRLGEWWLSSALGTVNLSNVFMVEWWIKKVLALGRSVPQVGDLRVSLTQTGTITAGQRVTVTVTGDIPDRQSLQWSATNATFVDGGGTSKTTTDRTLDLTVRSGTVTVGVEFTKDGDRHHGRLQFSVGTTGQTTGPVLVTLAADRLSAPAGGRVGLTVAVSYQGAVITQSQDYEILYRLELTSGSASQLVENFPLESFGPRFTVWIKDSAPAGAVFSFACTAEVTLVITDPDTGEQTRTYIGAGTSAAVSIAVAAQASTNASKKQKAAQIGAGVRSVGATPVSPGHIAIGFQPLERPRIFTNPVAFVPIGRPIMF